MKELAYALEIQFVHAGRLWRIGEDLQYPTAAIITKNLIKMRERISNEPVGTQIELGGIIMAKTSDTTYDIYAHFGQLGAK